MVEKNESFTVVSKLPTKHQYQESEGLIGGKCESITFVFQNNLQSRHQSCIQSSEEAKMLEKRIL